MASKTQAKRVRVSDYKVMTFRVTTEEEARLLKAAEIDRIKRRLAVRSVANLVRTAALDAADAILAEETA